ncbi:cullin-associated NEDD8-dissociated protein 1 [Emericellopsis cladophorae]|uniref:Cullin-associated NEDD8-dissociated protein 1 n=1 Tax=Emericellopsis cladophorae TaxID=2686198 RepID=A0A9Q0BGD9_9HYPO|nr:cullin-associated NEDD8-dissociated protein 1 [Emericellopsis cladophorae]KAI6784922.1 cullin-associated NEDD8-dissociated protein 1 [Emericellopsis cladophorae]
MAAPQQASPQAVMNLIGKLNETDPDLRFMSLNDLLQLLNNAKADFLHHDYNTAARAVDNVIKTLDDQNGEVQNLAIKCLGPLVKKVPSSIIAPMIDKLSQLKLKNAVDTAVPSLALRTVITALPRPTPGTPSNSDVQESYKAISRVLIPRLLGPGPNTKVPQTQHAALPPVPEGMLEVEGDVRGDAIDVMIEVVRCFGPMLEQVEVEAMQEITINILSNEKGTSVVKKRAVVAVSMLAVYLTEQHLQETVERIAQSLRHPVVAPVARKLYISILGSMARSVPVRFGRHVGSTAPLVLEALSASELKKHMQKVSEGEDIGLEFNEVREAALVTIEAFLASCPQDTKPFTDELIASCLRYLKYDPNYATNEDDEMEVDEDEDDMDEDEDEDEDFDEDDTFDDDDDDASWKVRRCAAKALYTLIATRGSGELLENGVLYKQAAPPLVKRIDEREENVRLEVLSTLSLLVRRTGEGLHATDLGSDELEPEVSTQVPVSRKRRRQSSVGGSAQPLEVPGSRSPILDKIPLSGPQADLASLVPSIIKAATKHLKGKAVPTKQAIIRLLDDTVSVQRGGLTDHLSAVIGPVVEAAKASGSGTVASAAGGTSTSASATPSTLKVEALRLISDIAKTHSSASLQAYLPEIVAGVQVAVQDRFYKISSEAIRTIEELIKATTPPRAKGTRQNHKTEINALFDIVMQRSSSNDADAEVRQRALHALGVLVSRTSNVEGDMLLATDKRNMALAVVQERLKNETSRLAAVRAVDQVAATAQAGQLQGAWVREVALELAVQLRKSNRSLRGSSIVALKHLILSPASRGNLDDATIQGVVDQLLPSITNGDTHLLGPSLVILAHLVPDHAELVMTQEMVVALSALLKSPSASIVCDAIIELVTSAGKAGAGASLMQALLRDVSIKGDTAVVGKVIGSLLVVSDGALAGVTVDSFVKELSTSRENKDDSRLSLALAVLALALGRAGSGNVGTYLPTILETMNNGGNMQYLLVQSLKEILLSITGLSADIRGYASGIWDKLLQASEHADNKIVCAECAGRLVILSPAEFGPRLQTLLSDDSLAVRGMAVQAIRYTLPESEEGFDAILRSSLVDMLLMVLQDQDMEIRRLGMTTLNSATHNKPDLVLPHLGRLVPFVLEESVIKPALIREVKLGPFTHTVDDGLEVRKSAYETLYALMETAFSRINHIDFYDRIVAGLKDDNDIRQLCNLMITKLSVIDPEETARRLDSIAEAYRAVLSVKLKENAVKQDIEKQEEANKSVLRVTLLLGDKMKALTGNAGAATSNAGAAGTWLAYWEWVNKDYEKQLRALREEKRELQTRMV